MLGCSSATALDVGCGTGKAATLVAARGVSVLGLEPDERMAEVARPHGLDVVVTPTRGWTARLHDVVYSAQAWHWVDPERGAAKAAEVLAPGGRWFALWNREVDERLAEVLTSAYQRSLPACSRSGRRRPPSDSSTERSSPGFGRREGSGCSSETRSPGPTRWRWAAS